MSGSLLGKRCCISPIGDTVFVTCNCLNDYVSLIDQGEDSLKNAIYSAVDRDLSHIKWITLAMSNSEIRHSIEVKKADESMKILVFEPIEDLINECLGYGGACGIVRMNDHKGLFSNAQIAISKARPNEWIGKKMSDYWFADELTNFMERLAKDGRLNNYRYKAKLFNGQVVEQEVDARVILYNDEPARIVKVISQKILT